MEHKGMIWMKMGVWLFPLISLTAGLCLYLFVSGCGFLGIVLMVAALIAAGFHLLEIWQKHQPEKAKCVQRAMWMVLFLVLILAAITVVPILEGPLDVKMRSDYVIVLGAGVKGEEPSEILRDRIEMAAEYLKRNPEVICIATGGKGDGENLSEAQCIYNHLTAMGIDGSRIWLEDKATSTIENFRYSVALIEEKTGSRPQSVTVLSNEFHLYRASLMARDCGLEADFVAAPTSSGMIRLSYTLREIFALWKYLTIGG